MFALNQFPAVNFGFPDTCNTETGSGTAQVAYPNSAAESTGFPAPVNILIGGSPVHNLATMMPPSQGDLPGHSGVASGTVLGPGNTFVNAQTTLMGALPTKRMSSTGMSNTTNNPTTAITANQLRVIILSL
jgi:hypothetical protein